LFHSLAQAQRPHICPYLFYVLQTFGLCAHFSCITPSQSVFPIGWPNRILFFVIEDYLINRCVFLVGIVPTHFAASLIVIAASLLIRRRIEPGQNLCGTIF